MIATSDGYKEKENRIYHVKLNIRFTDGTEKELDEHSLFGLTINDDVSSADVFSIGSAIINVLTLKLDNSDGFFDEKEFYGAEVTVKIGLDLDEGTEWLQKGTYIADSGDDVSDVITVKAYDYMRNFDQDYAKSSLGFPATLGAIVRDACQVCGVDLATGSFTHEDFVVQTKPEASTFREVLAMVGQISCNWCRINRYGQLEIAFYDISGYEQNTGTFVEINDYLTGSVSTEDVVITGVKVSDGDNTYLAGEEGYVIAVEGNAMIQESGETVAEWIGEKLIGLAFRKMSVNSEENPAIEAGDLAKVIDRKGNMRKTLLNSVTYTFGGTQQLKTCAATPLRNSVERFSKSTKNYVKYREMLDKYKTSFDNAVDALGKRLDGASGLFETTEKQLDGSYKYFLHDKPQLKDSMVIMQITSEALAISTDGGKTWPTGITVDGEAIISILKARGISASWINTGELVIQDEGGKTIFSANKDTGTVLISGDCVRIGDQNLEEALKDTKTLVMQFDREYATVNVDDEGHYSTFPEIIFQPTVYFGALDVTADCIFTVTASSYVNGLWNNSARIYTVKDLIADTAWIDVKAVYARNYIATKRFTVAKLYAGQKGESADNYFLEVSNDIIVKSKNGALEPNTIDISAYSRSDGAREKYAGYFIIHEISEDNVRQKVYESNTPESELKHYLHTILMANQTTPVMGKNNVLISGTRDSKMVNIELYMDQEKTILLQTKTVSFVQKMEELTGEEMFNILTNNGEVQGLYRMNGKIYINGEYIKSKTVKADAINVEDLYAIGATIGGWSITEDGIVKDIEDADGNTYRVKFRPPLKNAANSTMVLYCSKKEKGSTKWGRTFCLTSGGNAYFGDMYIGDTRLKCGNVEIHGKNYTDSNGAVKAAPGFYVGAPASAWTDVGNGPYESETPEANTNYGIRVLKSNVTVLGRYGGGYLGTYDSDKDLIIDMDGYTVSSAGMIQLIGGRGVMLADASSKKGYSGYAYAGTLCVQNKIFAPNLEISKTIKAKGDIITNSDLTCKGEFVTAKGGYIGEDLTVEKNFTCRGKKSRVVDTQNYGERYLYCAETSTPYFMDFGSGCTDSEGVCYIEIDDVFSETVGSESKYFVFLQAEGKGELYVGEKERKYFTVRGTPNLEFAWEIKAVQRGYNYERLETFKEQIFREPDYEEENLKSIYLHIPDYEGQAADMVENIYERMVITE